MSDFLNVLSLVSGGPAPGITVTYTQHVPSCLKPQYIIDLLSGVQSRAIIISFSTEIMCQLMYI